MTDPYDNRELNFVSNTAAYTFIQAYLAGLHRGLTRFHDEIKALIRHERDDDALWPDNYRVDLDAIEAFYDEWKAAQ